MQLLCQPVLLLTVLLVIHARAAITTVRGGAPTTVSALEEVSPPTPIASEGSPVMSKRERQERRQQRQEKRRLAEARRSNRERDRRQREQFRRQRQLRGRIGGGSVAEANLQTVELSWLAANLSSLWQAVRSIESSVGDIVQKNNLISSAGLSSVSVECDQEGTDPSECPVGDAHCRQTALDSPCSGQGACCCGQCQCQARYFGRYCECSEEDCESQDCGGHGTCSCGLCFCESGYEGAACECPTSTKNCTDPHNDLVCNNNGQCQCGVCSCQNGNYGQYCEETSYSAGLCEELKPCVLCNAYGKIMPQCSMCSHVIIQTVPHLEPSNKMCRMVHSGCLLQYSYQRAADGRFDVMVPEDSTC